MATVLLVVVAPGFAGADVPPAPTPGAVTEVIHIEEDKGLRFVGPASVNQGDQLEIVNDTDGKKVGPHTFSLVTKGSLPKTPGARKSCFTPKHICMSIAKWHGVKGEGPVEVNPVDAGPEGWSTLGSTSKTGDSWFTGVKKGSSFKEVVSADPATTPTLYYLCAIHPWMQGQIKVLPAGS
jgi:hypothetical protein